MNQLYPLTFQPVLKDKIWGGQKLTKLLGKSAPGLPNIGESWEISGVDGDESSVANGFLEGNTLNELVEIYMGDLVGDKVYERFGNQFPLLIKFIDATDDLSIQVHPNDEIAMERHDSYGKTEMWYVMQADKGSKLISGFKTEITCESYLNHLNSNSLMDVLGEYEVTEGDVLFVPAGQIHAIGKGIMLAEIQQTSDVTYRIFDYNRSDATGQKRELHTDWALDVITYKKNDNPKVNYTLKTNQSNEIVKCDYFTTNIIDVTGGLEKDYFNIDSFVILICVEGEVSVASDSENSVTVSKGQTVLIPAECKSIILNSSTKSRLLEVYI